MRIDKVLYALFYKANPREAFDASKAYKRLSKYTNNTAAQTFSVSDLVVGPLIEVLLKGSKANSLVAVL